MRGVTNFNAAKMANSEDHDQAAPKQSDLGLDFLLMYHLLSCILTQPEPGALIFIYYRVKKRLMMIHLVMMMMMTDWQPLLNPLRKNM